MSSQVAFSLNAIMQCSSSLAAHQLNAKIAFRRIDYNARKNGVQKSFFEGSSAVFHPQLQRIIGNPKGSFVSASLITSSQIASTAFTWGTISVLPFYMLMALVPKSTITKRVMDSNIPFVALAMLYGYLLYLSWTPSTLNVIFATKYLLPELPGMAKMFANEMTMASAWIHLLLVDLYAARQVYLDGLKDNVETRHSVTFCLLFCPIGILTHLITKGALPVISTGGVMVGMFVIFGVISALNVICMFFRDESS